MDQLIERARTSIEQAGEQIDKAVFDRFAKRLSYVAGDFGDLDLYKRLDQALEARQASAVLPGDPAQPVRSRGRAPGRQPGSPTAPGWRWRSRSATT